MEMQATVIGSISTYKRIKAYFQSHTYINLEKTDEKVFLREIIEEILDGISDFQESGSGWYFKEVIRLEIHIVDYKPMKGASYIPLPEFIQKKMQSLISKMRMINVFFGLFFAIFILFKKMEKE